MEEAAIGFQNWLCCGPTQSDKVSGYNSALGCVSGLKRFGHGSEIFSQATGLTGDQTESVQNLRLIEAQQLCRSRRRTEGSACARGMKAILIVAGGDSFPGLAFPFHASRGGRAQFL